MGLSTKDSLQECGDIRKQIKNFEKIDCKKTLNEISLKIVNLFQVLSKIDILKINRKSKRAREALVDRTKAQEIQSLYDFRKHRAVQEVLFGPIIFCKVNKTVVEDHFISLLTNDIKCNILDIPNEFWPNSVPSKNDNLKLTKHFSRKEVKIKLLNKIRNNFYNSRNCGLEQIQFQNLLKHDEDCSLLTAFFNVCLKLQTIPENWKQTFSVLIQNNKDLDQSDIKNWHSVTMINTIPKLFQAILASRLSLWARNTNRLSATQKRFLLNDTVCQTSFILQECKYFAEKNKKDLAIVWLDFSSASEVLSQEAVLHSLQKHSVPQCIINIIKSMIVNVETKFRVSDNDHFTQYIKILKGLPQGAPINPILLNLVIEPILRSLSSEKNVFEIFGQKINHFVIPNELVLIAESRTGLQHLLNVVEKQAKLIGLKFNIPKCLTFYYNHIRNSVEESKFVFFSQKLQNLQENKITEFFGVKQGLSIGQNGVPTINELTESIEAIDKSHLHVFQKLDSILTFLMPRVESCLRGLQNCDKTFIEEIDKFLKKKIISWLSLPDDAVDESIVFQVDYLKNHTKQDKQTIRNFLPFLDLLHIMQIIHGFKMLTSDNIIVKTIAIKSLHADIYELTKQERKEKKTITNNELGSYLTGSLWIRNVNITSFWKRIRKATLYLKKKINLTWKFSEDDIQLVINKKKKKTILKEYRQGDFEQHLKKALVQFYVNKIKQKNSEDIKKLEAIRSRRIGNNGRKRPAKQKQSTIVRNTNTLQIPSLHSTDFPVLNKKILK